MLSNSAGKLAQSYGLKHPVFTRLHYDTLSVLSDCPRRTQHPASGSSPQQTRTRHETIFNLAESVSASLSALGSALRHVTPSVYMAPAELVCIHSCGKSSDSCFEFTQDDKNCSMIRTTQAHSFSDKILRAHLQTVLSVERKALRSQQLF